MATQTTNIGLSKPDYNDTADIAVINSNMDKIDSTVNNIEKGIAIVSDGNTHSAIAADEYVYVRDHSTLAEGLYVASSAIAANATLTSSNLTAKSKGIGGEVASLNNKIANVDGTTVITNLDNVPVNSKGRILLDSSISPISNATFYANYICVGSSSYRTIIVWNAGKDNQWMSRKNGSSAAWTAWYSETNQIANCVTGPSSVTSGTIPLYDGTTGKAIKAGKTITDNTSSTAIANNANIPTNRTIYNAIYDGLNKTAAGFALDARQGKELSDKINNLQHYQFTCLKNGGKLRFSCSNTTGSWWLIFVGRGTIAADMGGWFAVVGSTSSSLRELYSPGSNLAFDYDSTSQKLTLTNGDTTNDIYVSVIRIFGTGTMTTTQA